MPDHSQDPHAVYRIYDADGTLAYIGSTWNPEQRIKQHTWAQGLRVDVVWYPTRREGRLAEYEAIRTERPRNNYMRYLTHT